MRWGLLRKLLRPRPPRARAHADVAHLPLLYPPAFLLPFPARSYKTARTLPPSWRYESATASTLVA